MRLTDLEPAWLTQDVFIFKNPTGGRAWLTCKRVPMTMAEQRDLFDTHPQYPGTYIVPTKPDYAWKFQGNDFNTLTVSPSLDASASGNWHGHITGGEIR